MIGRLFVYMPVSIGQKNLLTELRRHQAKVINRILDHKDTIVIAATSSGKSLCGIIPSVIHHDKLTLIIEPLTVLMHDQVNKLCELGIRAAYIDSIQSKEQQRRIYQQLKAGSITLLYVSPERLAVLPDLVTDQVWLLAVDECHCVATWGNSFRADYLKIGDFVEQMRSHPTILVMTASASPEDREQIAQLLGMKNGKVLQQDLYRSDLYFLKCLAPSRQEQLHLTRKYLRKYHAHTTITFCSTTDAVKAVAKELDKDYRGDVVVYHGRDKRNEKHLLAGEKHLIVATNALAMVVDPHNVDLVILFNMPTFASELYQMLPMHVLFSGIVTSQNHIYRQKKKFVKEQDIQRDPRHHNANNHKDRISPVRAAVLQSPLHSF